MAHARRSILVMAALGLIAWLAVIGTVQAAPTRQPGDQIRYDEIVQGHLTDAQAEDTWLFTGHAGDVVLIDMRASDAEVLDSYLTLLDPHGSTVMSDDDGGDGLNARIGPYQLDTSGEYTILASRYSGTGDYSLELKDLSTIPTLSIDKPLIGVVGAAHSTDFFRLPVPPEDTRWLLRVAASDDDLYNDPYLALYGPMGFVASTEYQDSSVLDPIAPIPGEVYVVAVSWNSNSAGGPYEITLGESTVELLQDGIPQTRTLDYENYMQQHFFRAQEGHRVRVTVRSDDNIAPVLEITSADAVTYLFSSDGETVRELSVVVDIPISTVYIVSVRDGSYMGETGAYTLQLDWVP